MHKKIFAICFLLLSGIVFVSSVIFFCAKKINPFTEPNLESRMESAFLFKDASKEVYGLSNRVLAPRAVLINGEGTLVKLDEGYLRIAAKTDFDTDFAKENILELKNVCDENKAEFLYVNYPSKFAGDFTSQTYGIDTNYEELRQDFLEYTKGAGIKAFDMREKLESEGFDEQDVFYKTDHHWKTYFGLHAAKLISEYIEENNNIIFAKENLDENKFSYKTYEDFWLGELGRMLSASYVGYKDEFTLIKPLYETSLTLIQENKEETKGDFSVMIDEKELENPDKELYTFSAHYLYSKDLNNKTRYHNNKVNGPEILYIGDSFGVTTIPFLALAASDVYAWDMRKTDESLYDFIRENSFDIVILGYTDYWTEQMWDFN